MWRLAAFGVLLFAALLSYLTAFVAPFIGATVPGWGVESERALFTIDGCICLICVTVAINFWEKRR